MNYEIILIVSASLFVVGQIVYQLVVARVKREMKETRRKLMSRKVTVIRNYQPDPFRNELDIDLGVKKVDKVRFGDEA